MDIVSIRKRLVSAGIVLVLIMGGFGGIFFKDSTQNGHCTADDVEEITPNGTLHDTSHGKTRSLLAQTPPAFTQNRGQLDNDDIRYYVQGGSLWFTDEGVWFDIFEEEENEEESRDLFDPEADLEPKTVHRKGVVLKQEFINCNDVIPQGVEKSESK